MKAVERKVCSRCVMDDTDPNIIFDSNGICNHCKKAENDLQLPPIPFAPDKKKAELDKLVDKVKKVGKGRKYDCIIGLSGGVDSSFTAYQVKQLGLRPLAVHLDNGWDSELAVKNIEKICKKLDIDLYTWVLDWEEFKDIQLAFLRASTPDSEIPSDNAIFMALWNLADRFNIKYILAGYNIASESIMPKAWSQGYFDADYIKGVHREFGTLKLRKTKILSEYRIGFLKAFKGVDLIPFLNYLDYDKALAKKFIIENLEWKDYGRKHCESNYTRIYQEYILPNKFGIDKRKAHLSSLIMAGQMTREKALKELEAPLYEDKGRVEEDILYLCGKFGITRDEFEKIMAAPPRRYEDCRNQNKTLLYRIIRFSWNRYKLLMGRS